MSAENRKNKDIEQLYRDYQSYRNKGKKNLIKTDNELILRDYPIDKNSDDYKHYQQLCDQHWNNNVEKAKARLNKEKTKGMKITQWSGYSMLCGIILGLLLHTLLKENLPWVDYFIDKLEQFGNYFINILKYAAIPLVIISLIDAIISVDKNNALWRIGKKSIALYFITTLVATAMALFITQLIGLGVGHHPADYETVNKANVEMIINGLTHPFAAMDSGNMIPAILFAIFVAMAIRSSGNNIPLIHQGIQQLNKVMQTMLSFILWLFPLAIFALTTVTMATFGGDIILQIMAYFLTVTGILMVHIVLTYSTLLYFSDLNPLMFFRKMLAVKLFAFSTSSSNATIPISIKNAVNRLGISSSISSFVIPLGATVNMDGTAIMMGVASIFGANLFGIDLTLWQYLALLFSIIFASIAIAGIPKGSLAMLSLILTTSIGLKTEDAVTLIGIIMTVDYLLDMLRTAVNVTGDATIACVIAAGENELNHQIFDDPNACCILEKRLIEISKK